MLSDKTRKVPCVPWEEYEPCPVSGRIQFVQDDVCLLYTSMIRLGINTRLAFDTLFNALMNIPVASTVSGSNAVSYTHLVRINRNGHKNKSRWISATLC